MTFFETGDIDGVKRMELFFDINYPYDQEKTPLLLAIVSRQYKMAFYLLEQGADPHQADDNDITPIQWLCRTLYTPITEPQYDLFKILINECPVLPSRYGDTVFSISVELQNEWLFQECITRSITYYNLKTMMVSIERLRIDIFRECTQVDVTQTGKSEYGYYTPFELVCVLVSKGVEINDINKLKEMFTSLLPSYKYQLTYQKNTCFHMMMQCYPWTESVRAHILPLFTLLYSRMNLVIMHEKDQELVQTLLEYHDTEVLSMMLPSLPRHIRIHYLLAKNAWITTVPELQPLLEKFYQRDIVMDKTDWMEAYHLRFEPDDI